MSESQQPSRVLCPVDLAGDCQSTIELASTFAVALNGKLVLFYAAPPSLPNGDMFTGVHFERDLDNEKERLFALRPTDESISYEHLFVYGNPGPEIVRASESCAMVVMSTHGSSGIARWLLGSVTEYVMRHADCPVLTFRIPANETDDAAGDKEVGKVSMDAFVTKIMQHVKPIRDFDEMSLVAEEFADHKITAAPVANEIGRCIGILTDSDIARYHDLKKRQKDNDETVIDEIFETDEYGMRRASNTNFSKVLRHMTEPVVTISDKQSCRDAQSLFADNEGIHHLVVVNDANIPLGIVCASDVEEVVAQA